MDERTNHITWGQYFMGIARLSAMRSKDPHTQVGACIVDGDNRILSVGYNGMPRGCRDDAFPWSRENLNPELTKYPYVVHAELNAILNYRGGSLEGSTLYVTMFPCNECAKAIIQAGIRKVVYAEEYRASRPSKRMLEAAGVECMKYSSDPIGLVYRADAENGVFDELCGHCTNREYAACGGCPSGMAVDFIRTLGIEL